MIRYKIPSAQKVYLQSYAQFRGVDFSADPTQVAVNRGARGTVNLIADSGGFPEKRKGWRVLAQGEGPIHGLYRGTIDGEQHFLVHGGSKLYRWQTTDGKTTLTILREGLTSARGTSFCMGGKLYVLTGGEYLVYDGKTVQDVTDLAYVPTTSIGNKPTGGGTSFEDVNLLSSKRKNEFSGDGTTKVYQLDTTDVTAINEITVNGTALSKSTYTLAGSTGKVTFSTAPSKPSVTGTDNVVITFEKKISGYIERITKCTISALYGGEAGDRVFLAGNDSIPDMDWHSESGDPTYFSDLSYTRVGESGSPIMGYAHVGSTQVILKSDDRASAAIYLRSYAVSGSTVLFPVKRGVSGIGAVAKGAFSYLLDEPLFLSRTGVFALTQNNLTAAQTAQNRSFYVDTQLTREDGLEQAVAVAWAGCYILCVNGHCYILDGNQEKAYKPDSYGDYVYECYYWENVPAVAFLEFQGALYFGTEDGRVCRFNNDLTRMDAYSDNDGEPVRAAWYTRADDDGDFMAYKTMQKNGSGVRLRPYTRSSVQVLARTERDFGRELRAATMDIFDWEDVDFSRFSFSSNDAPQVLPFRRPVRRYKTLQLIVKNEKVGEAFGCLGIVKRYTFGRTVR